MSLSLGARQTRFLQDHDSFSVSAHRVHARLYQVAIAADALRAFFGAVQAVDVQELAYVPFRRFGVARELERILGTHFKETIRAILRDRASGGFATGVEGTTANADDYVKFATAVTHLVGPSNFDAMSGTYYARFTVKHTDDSDSYLRQAYHTLTLHTDGTFVDEPTDWLLLMKFFEEHARGGESRLLHLDDWKELERFASDALASHPFVYRPAGSKNVAQPLMRRTFFDADGKPGLCFIDQFVYPQTLAEAAYLEAMSASMECSAGTINVSLPVGDLFMLNNTFWAHGRAPFERDPQLSRELMRQRGAFSQD
jgi:protein CsiD